MDELLIIKMTPVIRRQLMGRSTCSINVPSDINPAQERGRKYISLAGVHHRLRVSFIPLGLLY